jgi:hypothetical protein
MCSLSAIKEITDGLAICRNRELDQVGKDTMKGRILSCSVEYQGIHFRVSLCATTYSLRSTSLALQY